ncbi:LysR family transcriptional regulator [Tistlia consotensis]|nr:LysR family transcriptional regulator [Tistlia consotensis]
MKDNLKVDLRSVTLKQLRALAGLQRSGSVSATAQELGVTPPAVTMQLKQLEAAAALPLVERSAQGFAVTQAGAELVETARRIEEALRDGTEALTLLKRAGGGHVAVGVVSTAKYFAPRVLAAFAAIHPGVEIRLDVGNRSETLAALREHELDIAVMGRPPEDFEIDQATIGDHPHIIVAPPDHPLAEARDLPLEALAGETFLLREEGSGTRALTLRLFARAGFAPRFGMAVNSNETIKQAVMAGLGIAMISGHTVGAELEHGRLCALDVEGLPVVRQWFVAKRHDKRLLPAARALWDFFADRGAGFLPEVATRRD